MDPIRFEEDIRVTIQALGWRSYGIPALQDDISSVAYWYQTPSLKLPELPDRLPGNNLINLACDCICC